MSRVPRGSEPDVGRGSEPAARADVVADRGRLIELAEALPQIVFTAEPSGSIDYVNEAFYALTGLRGIDLRGGEWLNAFHPDDRDRTVRIWADAVAGSHATRVEARLLDAHAGGFRWHVVSARPILDANGRVVQWYGSAIDIHDWRVAEDALHDREERFRSIYDLVPVSIWDEDWSGVIDIVRSVRDSGVRDFEAFFAARPDVVRAALGAVRVHDVNQATLAMFEAATKEELLAALPSIFASRDMPPSFVQDLVALCHGRRQRETELELRTVKGRTLHALLRLAFPALDDASGRVLVSVMDITSRREAEERFQTVVQATSDAVWDHDLVHDSIWCSEGMRLRFGHDPKTFLVGSVAWLGAIHTEDLPRVRAHFDETMRGAALEWSDEYRFRRGDGSIAWVRDRGVILRDGEGVAVRMIGSMVDITEQRRLEEQLRQAQRLDAVGQLTGGIAHDFNNLLTVILGNTEAVRQAVGDDARLSTLADMTAAAAVRGAELTSRLLAFARRQALDPTALDLNTTIAGVEGLLQRSLGEHIEIRIALQQNLWEALVDRPQFESALLNLCLNARDAMPRGGRLTIETANVIIEPDEIALVPEVAPGAYVMIAVSDTGCGMDPETRARAVEPFFTTKDVGKGSGLGLSMVYGFVKQSRGALRLYSEVGLGTSVKLYFPRTDAAAEPEAIDVEVTSEVRCSESILVVEDDELVRTYVEGQLASLGYRVTAVGDGHAALAVLRADPSIEVLFTDVVMPGGMSGRQLADAALEFRPDLAVLFTSGYTENAIVHHGRLDPGVHLLQKPYRRRELAARLREVLTETRIRIRRAGSRPADER